MSDDDAAPARGRPFLGVQFECCGVYARVYRDGDHYRGRCPKCMRTVQFRVGEGGTGQRFWRVR